MAICVFPQKKGTKLYRKKYKKTWTGPIDWQGRLVKDSLFEKKVVYLQCQNDNDKHLYNQYVQLCSIQKKLKT